MNDQDSNPQDKQRPVTRYSIPANYPVAYMYYANGLHHYAGSCCDLLSYHTSEIISPEQLELQSCDDSPIPATGMEMSFPGYVAPGESPEKLVVCRGTPDNASQSDNPNLFRNSTGLFFRLGLSIIHTPEAQQLVDEVQDTSFQLTEIDYSEEFNACTYIGPFGYCALREIRFAYNALFADSSSDDFAPLNIMDCTFDMVMRVARAKVDTAIPELQYLDIYWGS